MAYRRNGSSAHAWKEWVSRRLEVLTQCGVPDFLYRDEARWERFLQESYDISTGWTPEMLEPKQAEELRHFLQREYGNTTWVCRRLFPDD